MPTPGGPIKQRMGAFLLPASPADRDVLDDALLDLFEAVVVFVQAAPCLLDRELVGRALAPRHVGQPLEVGARDVVLRGLRLHGGQAPELLARDLLHFVGEARVAEPLAELLDLVLFAALAELLLDGAHLLAEDVLALGLALVGDHRGDFALHAQELELPVDDGEDGAHARLGLECLEDLLLVGDARLLHGEVRRDEIGQGPGLSDVVEDGRRLPRKVRQEREDVARPLAQARAEGVELDVSLEILGNAPRALHAWSRRSSAAWCRMRKRARPFKTTE